MSTTDDKFPVTGLMVERQRGLAFAATQPGHTLPLGTRLRDFEITGLIGEGGFGIVYLAWDHSLQRRVAVKEYMPTSMVARVGSSAAIVVQSERQVDTVKAGLKSFVNEARLLARFNHPSLVKVYRFWEDHGTAYMVIPYYQGPTLKVALAALGHVPSENEIRAWLKPILNALSLMHASQCYHRDIAPDNILLRTRGPLLLDFGAARRVIGDMTHAMTVVLKPGFAPIEQYGDVASMAQGAWTDLYALACVVYYAITGKTPTSSVERLMDDRLQPLSKSVAGQYSPAFLRAIDAALPVRPADRPRNDRQFSALLDDAPASLWPALLEEPHAHPSTTRDPLTTEVATQVLAPPVPPASLASPASPNSRASPRPATRASARQLRECQARSHDRGRAGLRPCRRARHRLRRARREVPVQPWQHRVLVRPQGERRVSDVDATDRARSDQREGVHEHRRPHEQDRLGPCQRRALAAARELHPPAPDRRRLGSRREDAHRRHGLSPEHRRQRHRQHGRRARSSRRVQDRPLHLSLRARA